MSRSETGYIPELEGLRGLAILLILFFHLGFQQFSGGFVGVDVFFVLSGFLITRGILQDLGRSSFSFTGFFEKRFKKIFPSMTITLIACVLLANMLLAASHLQDFNRSLAASILSFSNLHFYLESGYFDVSSRLKPLLHFWALSVQWQFYILWPILVYLLYLFKRTAHVFWGLAAIGLLSLYASHTVSGINGAAAYYLLPFRIMEFAFGGLCVWLMKHNASNKALETFFLAGLALILFSATVYDEFTRYPGYNSLLPCLGTVLVIICRLARYSPKILRNRLLMYLGKISYSLYLVHWPIIVFSNHASTSSSTTAEKHALLFLSVLCAHTLCKLLSWNNPRIKIPGATPRLKKGLTSSIILVLSASILLSHLLVLEYSKADTGSGKGVPGKALENLTEKERWPLDYTLFKRKYHVESFTWLGKPDDRPKSDILFMGDSHVAALGWGFSYLGKKHGFKTDRWTHLGCPPLWGTYKHYPNEPWMTNSCRDLVPLWEKVIESGNYDVIMLANRWMWLYEHDDYGGQPISKNLLVDRQDEVKTRRLSRRLFEERLRKTVEKIHESGSRAVIFSQVPLITNDIESCKRIIAHDKNDSQLNRLCDTGVGYDEIMARQNYTDTVIRSLASDDTFVVIPTDFFCDHERKTCRTFLNGTLLYADKTHVSRRGAVMLAKTYEDELMEFMGKKIDKKKTSSGNPSTCMSL